MIDEYEGRTFEGEEDKIKRVGAPENLDNMNNPGTTLIIQEKGKTKVIKTYTKQDKIVKNKKIINKVLANANIPQNVIEKVKSLYIGLAKNFNMQGKKFSNIIIALYFHACKILNQAKTMKEITKMFNISERELKKTYSKINRHIIDEDNDDEEENGNDLTKTEAQFIKDYIGGNIEKYEMKMLACKIVENINKNSLFEGKAPKTIAGLALLLSYIIFNENIDDSKEFYSTFSSRATLSKYFEEVKSALALIIPKEYTDKIEQLKNTHI